MNQPETYTRADDIAPDPTRTALMMTPPPQRRRSALAALLSASALALLALTPTLAAAQDDGAWGDIPEQTELSMSEEEPAVEQLGQQDGVSAFRVGELTVLHKPTPANQVVSARLYYIGGTQRLGPETTGLEKMALGLAVNGGTESTSKDDFNAQLDAMGASVSSFTDRDYSGITMKTIVPYFDDVWGLYIQTILEPAMPSDELELARKRQLAQIDSLFENPDSQVSYITTQALFEGHPYAHLQLGTREAVEGYSREDALAWQRAITQPDQMLLVVVGDVAQADLIGRLKDSLGRLQSTRPAPPELPAIEASEPELVFEQRELPTNYVFGLYTAPAPGEPDYPAMVVAMDYLSDRLFEEVRTKRNLTYAVSAGISSRRANYGYLYVTATKPEETLGVILGEVDRLKQETMSQQELTETLNVFLTNHYMGQETNTSQAAELAHAYITTGDWRTALLFLEQIRAVTPEDVQRVVKTYLQNYHFGVVGPDKSALPTELMKQ